MRAMKTAACLVLAALLLTCVLSRPDPVLHGCQSTQTEDQTYTGLDNVTVSPLERPCRI